MIEVLEAIEFRQTMNGGRTYPWLLHVLQNGEPVPYVDKLYIDHEYTFPTIKNANKEVLNFNKTWSFNYKRHLFHQVIKDMNDNKKEHCFDTFFDDIIKSKI